MKISFTLNDQATTWDVHPGETLLEALRREGFYGTKRGCNTGDCGTCTVLIDGEAVTSCQVFAPSVEGKNVKTIEGVASRNKKTGELVLHPVQKKLIGNGAVQCGYCTAGVTLSAVGLLEKNPAPTEADIRRSLDGNLCRCTGYVKQLKAVLEAAGEMPAFRARLAQA